MTLNALNNQRLTSINVGKNFVGRKIQSRFIRHERVTRGVPISAPSATRLTYVRFKK